MSQIPIAFAGLQLGDHDSRDASLAHCVAAILRWSGSDIDYPSVHAALGLGFTTAAPTRPRCLGCWMTEGQDALLAEAAQLFGIRLRELHPPEAAVGLEDAPEFFQHFEASYRPLMELALEHGQPSLVYGRPDGIRGYWGIATARCEDGLGFIGVGPEAPDRPGRLNALPLQVYIVEEVTPRPVAADELLRHVLEVARRVQHNQLDPRFGIVTGPAAYDAWLARLEQEEVCPLRYHNGAACHARMAELVARSRETALAFIAHLRSTRRGWPADIEAWERACRGVIDALRRSQDGQAVSKLFGTPSGRSELKAEVSAARDHDMAVGRMLPRMYHDHVSNNPQAEGLPLP